jgi:hypothetical protein
MEFVLLQTTGTGRIAAQPEPGRRGISVRFQTGLAVATVLMLIGGVPANAQTYPPDIADATVSPTIAC